MGARQEESLGTMTSGVRGGVTTGEPAAESKKPWAFIAHKDNHWAGVTAADDSRDAGKFVADFVQAGFSIVTVYGREEYNKTLDGMKSWHEHPDYQDKSKRAKSAAGA